MDGLRQSTDVGESHRSTGHLVTWSPLIRLWAGVLVYETLGSRLLFTDEGSRRLPKCLNYCFSVLASATNRSMHT